MIEAVVFDIGETLVDETRYWEAWAKWLGVPRLTFLGALGAVIAQRRSHREVFDWMAADDPRGVAVSSTVPEFDLARAQGARRRDADDEFYGPNATWPSASDLYTDAIPCLDELKQRGFVVGVAGNQPTSVEAKLRTAGVSVDFCGSSERWGASKPSAEFFQRIAAECARPASAIAYVGDRVDVDVLPALAGGMVAIHLRRGPWGVVQGRWPEAKQATFRITSLAQLPLIPELTKAGRQRR